MRASLGLIGAASLLATPARAECLGSCLDAMVAALASIVVYGLIGIVLVVMLIRRKWRRAGLWALAVVAALALGVPMVSQGWQLGRVWALERHEVAGALPDISQRTPLILAPSGCEYGVCGAVLWGQESRTAYVLPVDALDGIDLTRPVALQDLPLELWGMEGSDPAGAQRRLAPAERVQAAGRIDYLVVAGEGYYRTAPDAAQLALRGNPALAGVGEEARVELMLAPLDPARRMLDLAAVVPEVLDLSLTSTVLAIPLAPMNTALAPNGPVAPDAVARAFCPLPDGGADLYCLNLLTR